MRRRKRKKRKKKASEDTLLFLPPHGWREEPGRVRRCLSTLSVRTNSGTPPRMHAEFLKAVHSKEDAGYTGEMYNFIEEKVIGEEETTLENGMPALSLYGDRTHAYTAPSRRCWLDWRSTSSTIRTAIGVRTGMDRLILLTSSCGQGCCEERAKQTLSGTPFDKTVKDLICLLTDMSLLQHGFSTWTSQRSSQTHSPNEYAPPVHR